MKTMTDKELDLLFAESAQQQRVVAQINSAVMQTVRRDMQLQTLRKWAKLLGLCFGIPVTMVVYIYILFTYMPEMPQVIRYICYALPLGTLAVFFGKNLHDFSPFEV